MILPKAAQSVPEEKTITLADGQTFRVLVVRPNHAQRFNDEGRELVAFSGTRPDAWSEYRLGRIRDCIIDWLDVTNEKEQPIPFTHARLLGLMDAAPEVVPQLTSISAEVFRPLEIKLLMLPDPPAGSGTEPAALPETQQPLSGSTTTSGEPNALLENSESLIEN